MDNRFYQAQGLNIEHIARELEAVLRAQSYQVQSINSHGYVVVQLRQGSDFEALLGMQAALTLTLQSVPGGVVATVGQQQWLDKAAAGALGIFFLWPLTITASAGVIRQAIMDSQLFQILDSIVQRQQANVHVGPLPPHMQGPAYGDVPPNFSAQQPQGIPGQIQCTNCQAINEEGDSFCSRCGKPLTPAQAKERCPQCHAEVKPDAAFCPKCGTQIAHAHSGR